MEDSERVVPPSRMYTVCNVFNSVPFKVLEPTVELDCSLDTFGVNIIGGIEFLRDTAPIAEGSHLVIDSFDSITGAIWKFDC